MFASSLSKAIKECLTESYIYNNTKVELPVTLVLVIEQLQAEISYKQLKQKVHGSHSSPGNQSQSEDSYFCKAMITPYISFKKIVIFIQLRDVAVLFYLSVSKTIYLIYTGINI